uniref:Integrase catalytic domain-containing protein n=1 Tax=Fagus sylvatica TaxID=28930 RepID=A0A2N9GHR0_FAGSY
MTKASMTKVQVAFFLYPNHSVSPIPKRYRFSGDREQDLVSKRDLRVSLLFTTITNSDCGELDLILGDKTTPLPSSEARNSFHCEKVKEALSTWQPPAVKPKIIDRECCDVVTCETVKALNSIFQQWDAQAASLWNTTGDPCSGSAIDDVIGIEDDPMNNPAIKCVCNGTTCHITQLRVYALNKRGGIPEELVALKYLTSLNIDRNYFTGPLPAFIGNLSALKKLSIGTNAFSGTIPKELGNLKELTLLAFGSNNFSGTLPPELGNLVKLEEIYMDSCGLGGEIPSTFANLTNMQTMWASDSPFTGKIPDFIGNWTKLTSLRFQGNSFEGPIPSSFSNLTSLTDLRIGDIYNVSSSLDFIKKMKSLTNLVLRNALITGSIPSDIGEYQSLQKLDLSFNNLTGEIPSAQYLADANGESSLNVNPLYKQWKARDQALKTLINATLSPSAITLVIGQTTAQVLKGLPPNYDLFCSAMRTRDRVICCEELHVLLTSEEESKKNARHTSSIFHIWQWSSYTRLFPSREFCLQGRQPLAKLTAIASTNMTNAINASSSTQSSWISDIGATDHFTPDISHIPDCHEYCGNEQVTVGNGQSLPINHTGNSQLYASSHLFKLHHVLHVPSMSSNLLSVHKFCKDNNASFYFDASKFCIKDLSSRRLLYNGLSVLHQFTCPHTSQQNGVAERKHRHIVDMGLTLMSQASLPLTLWPYAFSTSVFLINRLPSPHQGFISPWERLFGSIPSYSSFRSFGCACYPLLRPYSKHKFLPKSVQCVFLGYPSNAKGFLCFDPVLSLFFVSRHVKFDETVYPFHNLSTSSSLHKIPTHSQSSSPAWLSTLLYFHPCSLPSVLGPPPTSILSSHTPASTAPVLVLSQALARRNMLISLKLLQTISMLNHHLLLLLATFLSGMMPWLLSLSALQWQSTWSLVPSSPVMMLLACHWVFKLKRNPDGSVARYKARLVAKGNHQMLGIDFDETFSLVVKLATVRLMLSIAVQQQWSLRQLDVSNAFLHGSPKESYGSTVLYLLLYMDDIIITSNAPMAITELITNLASTFELKDLGPLSSKLSSALDDFLPDPTPYRRLPGPMHLTVFTDADWAGNPVDRHSGQQYQLPWASKKQPTVSRSSTKAEYRSLAVGAAEVAWIRMLLRDLHVFLSLSYGGLIIQRTSSSWWFLGNNFLSGALPSIKSDKLQNVTFLLSQFMIVVEGNFLLLNEHTEDDIIWMEDRKAQEEVSYPSDGAESWDEPYEARVLLLKWSTRTRWSWTDYIDKGRLNLWLFKEEIKSYLRVVSVKGRNMVDGMDSGKSGFAPEWFRHRGKDEKSMNNI